MAGLYFHIPFCKRICAYCDFYKSVRLEQMDGVTAAMHRELDERQDYLRGEAVTTRYFGGGTPSLYAPAALKGLLNHAAQLFDCSGAAETTLEANPDDLTGDYLAGLREAGIDRLSIGIQSFDDDCLKLMNRRHTAAQAIGAVRAAQRAGFGNITADLIFGIPGFGGDSLKRSLDGVLSLGVQHISAYHLTVEPGTAFGRRAARGQFAPVDEATSETEYALVHETLTGAGFEHYEVSNFALPGFRPPQRLLLAWDEIPRHRARSPLVRRRGETLECLFGGKIHSRRSRREGSADPTRPVQRICHDGAPDGRGDRSGRGRGTFRSKTAGADAGRGSTVPPFGYAPHSPGADGPPAGKIPDFGCRDRGTFRNITRHATM